VDELVRKALARWPNVPDCHGWLALDGRGQWRIGERRQPVANMAIVAFINRNYTSDTKGRWLFQNGPQRVYVELEYTPFIWRIAPGTIGSLEIHTHTGDRHAPPDAAWIDSDGRFLLHADGLIGVLHDHDSSLLVEHLGDATGRHFGVDELARRIDAIMVGMPVELRLNWPGSARTLSVASIVPGEVAHRFGFDPHPLSSLQS